MFRTQAERDIAAFFQKDNKKGFACLRSGCTRVFATERALKQHGTVSHPDPALLRPFACPAEGCTKTYVAASCLRRHQRDAHQVGVMLAAHVTCPPINFPFPYELL
jgi:hypothetical protein